MTGPGPRFYYLDGDLEVMTTSSEHDRINMLQEGEVGRWGQSVNLISLQTLDRRGRGLLSFGLMARKARIEFSGAVDHVLDRGDRSEAIFGDDDRSRTLPDRTGRSVRAHGLASPVRCRRAVMS